MRQAVDFGFIILKTGASAMWTIKFQELLPFAVSFIIGFLIGIERERSYVRHVQIMGIRTFILIALLGTLASWMNEPFFSALLTAFVLGLVILCYVYATVKYGREEKKKDLGIITELSAGLVYCIGYISTKDMLLSSILGALLLVILLVSKRLHEFSRHVIKRDELQAAVVIIVLSLIVFLFLPNYTIDPWQLFNPKQFGIILLLIACIQFGGYVSVRVLGDKLGTEFKGFFGGLISSTVVFLLLPKIYQQKKNLLYSITAAALLATIGMLIEFFLMIYVISKELALVFLYPVMSMIVVGLMCIVFFNPRKSDTTVLSHRMSPLDFKSVLKLDVFLFSMLIFVAIIIRYLGPSGGALVTFLGGLFEIHSVTLATAALYSSGKLILGSAELLLICALIGAFCSKLIILSFLARNHFGWLTAVCLCLMLTGGFAAYKLI